MSNRPPAPRKGGHGQPRRDHLARHRLRCLGLPDRRHDAGHRHGPRSSTASRSAGSCCCRAHRFPRFPAGCWRGGWRCSSRLIILPARPVRRPTARSSRVDQITRMEHPVGPLTLAIDVGGTRLKAGILAATGSMSAGPDRVDTPHPATPAAVVDALADLVRPLGAFDRISIGFPGVVRDGRVLTAPNLETKAWHGFPLARHARREAGRAGPRGERCDRAGARRHRRPRPGVRHHAGHRHGLRAVPGWQARAASRAEPASAAWPQDLRPVYRQCGTARGRTEAVEPARAKGNRLHRHADGLRHAVYRRRQFEVRAARPARHRADRLQRGGITGGIRLWDGVPDHASATA